MVVRQGGEFYNLPEQNDPIQWQIAVPQPAPQVQFEQVPIGRVIANVLGAVAVVGFGFMTAAAIGALLFGEEERVLHCSVCDSTSHTARNCPITGPRVRLKMEKTGDCGCCGRRFASTQLHHYAGRGLERGREMCLPCHLHCGHGGHWKIAPTNPQYCRLEN
jgi:hypothetical protein